MGFFAIVIGIIIFFAIFGDDGPEKGEAETEEMIQAEIRKRNESKLRAEEERKDYDARISEREERMKEQALRREKYREEREGKQKLEKESLTKSNNEEVIINQMPAEINQSNYKEFIEGIRKDYYESSYPLIEDYYSYNGKVKSEYFPFHILPKLDNLRQKEIFDPLTVCIYEDPDYGYSDYKDLEFVGNEHVYVDAIELWGKYRNLIVYEWELQRRYSKIYCGQLSKDEVDQTISEIEEIEKAYFNLVLSIPKKYPSIKNISSYIEDRRNGRLSKFNYDPDLVRITEEEHLTDLSAYFDGNFDELREFFLSRRFKDMPIIDKVNFNEFLDIGPDVLPIENKEMYGNILTVNGATNWLSLTTIYSGELEPFNCGAWFSPEFSKELEAEDNITKIIHPLNHDNDNELMNYITHPSFQNDFDESIRKNGFNFATMSVLSDYLKYIASLNVFTKNKIVSTEIRKEYYVPDEPLFSDNLNGLVRNYGMTYLNSPLKFRDREIFGILKDTFKKQQKIALAVKELKKGLENSKNYNSFEYYTEYDSYSDYESQEVIDESGEYFYEQLMNSNTSSNVATVIIGLYFKVLNMPLKSNEHYEYLNYIFLIKQFNAFFATLSPELNRGPYNKIHDTEERHEDTFGMMKKLFPEHSNNIDFYKLLTFSNYVVQLEEGNLHLEIIYEKGLKSGVRFTNKETGNNVEVFDLFNDYVEGRTYEEDNEAFNIIRIVWMDEESKRDQRLNRLMFHLMYYPTVFKYGGNGASLNGLKETCEEFDWVFSTIEGSINIYGGKYFSESPISGVIRFGILDWIDNDFGEIWYDETGMGMTEEEAAEYREIEAREEYEAMMEH